MIPATRRNFLVISLLSGCAAAAICWHGLTADRRPGDVRYENVLVFSRDADAGTPITPAMVRWARWPADAVSPGMLTRKGEADLAIPDGLALPLRFAAGDPVPRSTVEQEGHRAKAAPGMRAVPVKLKDDALATHLRPGLRIDLIFPARGGIHSAGGSRTIRGARVLEVQNGAGPRAGRGSQRHVLVELSAAQAEAAASAIGTGAATIAIADWGDTSAGTETAAATATVTLVKAGSIARKSATQQIE